MTIQLDLNAEQTDALKARTDLYNAGSGQPAITPNAFVRTVIIQPEIDRLVDAQFAAAVTAVTEGAKSLPYEQRLALLDQVRGAIPQ